MRETTEKELRGWIEAGERQIIVFGHTPFCGTCKAARRMLEVAEQIRPDIDVYALDLNFAPTFIERYRIGSTPSLSVFEPGDREPRTVYAMRSVPRLLDFIADSDR